MDSATPADDAAMKPDIVMAPPAADPAADPTQGGYPDGPVPYPLRKPVVLTKVDHEGRTSSETITQVFVREPLGDDLLALDKAKGEAESAQILIAVMCDQPRAFARKLTGWDFTRLGMIVARFFPQGMP
jgi:hypothetical protein